MPTQASPLKSVPKSLLVGRLLQGLGRGGHEGPLEKVRAKPHCRSPSLGGDALDLVTAVAVVDQGAWRECRECLWQGLGGPRAALRIALPHWEVGLPFPVLSGSPWPLAPLSESSLFGLV